MSSRSQHKSFSFQLFHLKCKQSDWKSKETTQNEQQIDSTTSVYFKKMLFYVDYMDVDRSKKTTEFSFFFFFGQTIIEKERNDQHSRMRLRETCRACFKET